MMLKVVINKCYGGFSISLDCAKRMAELGNNEAKQMLKSYEIDNHWYGFLYKTTRHDKRLVQAVEELCKKANGPCAELVIEKVYVPDIPYTITDYDGYEQVK